jgi:hypothetical protein
MQVAKSLLQGLKRLGHDSALFAKALIRELCAEWTDPSALVIGPTGLGLGRNGNRYVATPSGPIPNRLRTRKQAL